MCRIAGTGMVGGVLMLALCAGYGVLYLAKKQENPFKALGYAIAVFVIAISAALLLGKIFLYLNYFKR